MLRKLLPIGTLLLFVAALVIAPQTDAVADPWKNEAHQYDCRAPQGHQNWVPPGHLPPPHQRGWIPPGHRMHDDRHRGYRCDDWDDDDRWERDRRYRDDRRYRPMDTRDYRYEPRKHKRYDRDSEDYGLIIRKGPRGTTVDIEYRKRDW